MDEEKPPREYFRPTLHELVEQAYPEGTQSQDQIRDQVNAVLGAIKAWLVAQIITVESNQEARLHVQGFGTFVVSLARRGHHRNKRRLALGIVRERPQTVKIGFICSKDVQHLITRRNDNLSAQERGLVSDVGRRRWRPRRTIPV